MVVLVVLKVSNGKATPGDFTIVLMHGTRLWDSLDMVKHSFRAISQRLTGARLETFSATPTVADQPGAAPLRITEGSICFSNVSFKHGEKSILRRISATVSGGQTVGLVGETGAGKSTLLRLLAREFDVQGGSIHIDGQDIREATLQSLRNAIGILQQKPELLNRTIRENVSYGLTDTTTGTEIADKVEEACQAACIHRSIVHFVHGYDTMVGEQGINLSGGQRQQIAIARLMLTDPRVVLLDEPTSALDPKTEREIMHGPFGDWIANRTTFIVAHQLVTVKSADLILVMKHGQIVESGTHTQLIKNGRFYSELWNR
jgi:ATP-binding cassette subfamily B protein